MRVLLTRPKEQAQRTAARLQQAGHEVVFAPVSVIRFFPVGWPDEAYDALAITSARAVEALTDVSESFKTVPLWIVGEKTLFAARKAGLTGPALVTETVADLLARTPKTPKLRVIYLAGRDRKPDLEQTLHARGQSLQILECYAAEAASHLPEEAVQALQAKTIDAVLHYSERSATLFLEQAKQAGIAVDDPRHIALSHAPAAPLVAAGLRPDVACAPHEDAMLSALEDTQRPRRA